MFLDQVGDFPMFVDFFQRYSILLHMTLYRNGRRVQMPDTANSATVRNACTGCCIVPNSGFQLCSQVSCHRLCTRDRGRCLRDRVELWRPVIHAAPLVDRVVLVQPAWSLSVHTFRKPAVLLLKPPDYTRRSLAESDCTLQGHPGCLIWRLHGTCNLLRCVCQFWSILRQRRQLRCR